MTSPKILIDIPTAIKEEREACAKLAEEMAAEWDACAQTNLNDEDDEAFKRCLARAGALRNFAQAIRNRK